MKNFVILISLVLFLNTLSACCDQGIDGNTIPCYEKYIGETKEERQRKTLGEKRRPQYNAPSHSYNHNLDPYNNRQYSNIDITEVA